MEPGVPQAGPLSDMPTRLEGLVLDLVLMRSADVDLRVSIGGVRRAWRRAAAAERRRRLEGSQLPDPSIPSLPLWYIKRAWPGADSRMRQCLVATAAAGGRLDSAPSLRLASCSCNAWVRSLRPAEAPEFYTAPPLDGQASGLTVCALCLLRPPHPVPAGARVKNAPRRKWKRPVAGPLLRHLEAAADDAHATAAATSGNLDVLASLLVRGPPGLTWGPQLCRAAARGGALEALRWLRQDSPCLWDVDVCSEAVRAGQLGVLQWLRAQEPPCPIQDDICNEAVAAGQLGVLQWLRAQEPPFPLEKSAYALAAARGHLEVLKWLVLPRQDKSGVSRSPFWDPQACWHAAYAGGHTHVMSWLAPLREASLGPHQGCWFTLSQPGPFGFIISILRR